MHTSVGLLGLQSDFIFKYLKTVRTVRRRRCRPSADCLVVVFACSRRLCEFTKKAANFRAHFLGEHSPLKAKAAVSNPNKVPLENRSLNRESYRVDAEVAGPKPEPPIGGII